MVRKLRSYSCVSQPETKNKNLTEQNKLKPAHNLFFRKTACSCSSVTSLVRLLAIPWTTKHQASLFFTISQSLLKLMSIDSVMPSNHLIPSFSVAPFCSCPGSFPASEPFPVSRLFTSGGQSIGGSASASSEHSGLIFFSIDLFALLTVQGTLKSLLHHHSSKRPILQCSTFFMVQLSHSNMTTERLLILISYSHDSHFDPKQESLVQLLLPRQPGEDLCKFLVKKLPSL